MFGFWPELMENDQYRVVLERNFAKHFGAYQCRRVVNFGFQTTKFWSRSDNSCDKTRTCSAWTFLSRSPHRRRGIEHPVWCASGYTARCASKMYDDRNHKPILLQTLVLRESFLSVFFLSQVHPFFILCCNLRFVWIFSSSWHCGVNSTNP